MNDWYKRMFEGTLADYWRSVSDGRKEVTDAQLPFLKDTLKNGLVLDHCCEPGRISIPLSTHMPVVGLDLSRRLLNTAKTRAKQADSKELHLVRADMRHSAR